MSMRSLSVVCSVVLLAACGGGGGGGGSGPVAVAPPAQPPPQAPPPVQQPQPPPQPPPADTNAQVRSALSALIASSDTVTEASTINGEPFGWTPTIQPTPASLELEDLMKRDGGRFERLADRRGVSMALIQDATAIDFGGWMSHSFFFVNTWNPVGDDPLRPSESTFTEAYSVGSASGSNPTSGSATWTGTMAGIDENEGAATFGNLVRGDAAVTVGFASASVNVALTGIRDSSTGGSHGDIRWNGVSMRGGAFSSGTLRGRFYGPNHEEVGGIFLRNRISGAFGARRQ